MCFFPHAYGWEGSKMVSTRCFQVTHSKFVTLYMEVQDESLGFYMLQCSFCVLAEFVLAVWVSDFSWGFSSSALTLTLASQTDLFHSFSLLIFQDGPQRKKRKSEVGEVDKQLDILAIGTAVGSILLYSTVKGELQSKLVSNALFFTCYQTLTVSVSSGWKQ